MREKTNMSTLGRTESLKSIPRRPWGNWVLLASSYVITTGGLAMVIGILLPGRLTSPWPWIRTEYALVAACVFMVITLVIHLSFEQRQANVLNARFLQMLAETHSATQRRLYALLRVSRIMGLQSDLQHVFESIMAACLEAFTCDQASLMLLDADRRFLVVRAARGHTDPSRVLGTKKEIGEGIAGWVAKNKTPLILGGAGDDNKNPEIKLLVSSLSAAMVVPIILRDELVGVINVSSRSPGTVYEDHDLQALMVFAENAGACVRHAEQAEWMRKTIASLREPVERAGKTSPARS